LNRDADDQSTGDWNGRTVSAFIHQLALCEADTIGSGTRVWAFAHVMKGAQVGADCNIGEGVFVESGAVIGDRVTIKNQVMVWNGVTIDDEAFIGPGAIFTNDLRPRSPRMKGLDQRYAAQENWLAPTRVGRGASVGAGAIVLPGITIAEYAMVAAGAVVTRDVAAHHIVAGNPARPQGWACWCGNRLSADAACNACGTTYCMDDGVLSPMR
jgi:acetyltransferase-like isoleucine patch superfamily enzyme